MLMCKKKLFSMNGMKRKYEELIEDSRISDTEALREAALTETEKWKEEIDLGEELCKILREGEVEEE